MDNALITCVEMFEVKVVVGVASACSTLALIVCLATIPSLYLTINEIHDEVQDGIQVDID